VARAKQVTLVGPVRNLPNILSLLRMLATPAVFVLILDNRYTAVLVLFGAAALTDALDGWLARVLQAESKLGQLLDPLADKMLLTAAFIALAMARDIPWWLTLVVLGRDAAIVLGALALWTQGRRSNFPPSIWGKLSTIVQMGYVAIVVLREGADFAPAAWLVAAMAVASGADYARRLLPA
jgi:cardiolipin synthase (CMP-forming)